MDGRASPPGPVRNIDRTLRTVAIAAALLLAAWALQGVLLLAFAAILLACILRLASYQLGKQTGIGPRWGLLVVVAAVTAMLAALVWWRGPVIIDQLVTLEAELRQQGQRVWSWASTTSWGPDLADRLRSALPSWLGGFGGALGGIASSVFGIAGSALLVAVTALFLALSPATYVEGAVQLVPPSYRPRAYTILSQTGRTLQLWFVGQAFDMLAVTILLGIGLYALDMPLALTLALFAGLLNFIPYIGALIGAGPAVLVALGQSPTLALWVAGLFFLVQMIEGNLIAPLIQRRTVSLPPGLTIFSQTIIGTLFGPLGVVLATPVMAAGMTLVQMAYVEDVLEGE